MGQNSASSRISARQLGHCFMDDFLLDIDGVIIAFYKERCQLSAPTLNKETKYFKDSSIIGDLQQGERQKERSKIVGNFCFYVHGQSGLITGNGIVDSDVSQRTLILVNIVFTVPVVNVIDVVVPVYGVKTAFLINDLGMKVVPDFTVCIEQLTADAGNYGHLHIKIAQQLHQTRMQIECSGSTGGNCCAADFPVAKEIAVKGHTGFTLSVDLVGLQLDGSNIHSFFHLENIVFYIISLFIRKGNMTGWQRLFFVMAVEDEEYCVFTCFMGKNVLY